VRLKKILAKEKGADVIVWFSVVGKANRLLLKTELPNGHKFNCLPATIAATKMHQLVHSAVLYTKDHPTLNEYAYFLLKSPSGCINGHNCYCIKHQQRFLVSGNGRCTGYVEL